MVRMGEDGPEAWYRTEDGAWQHDPRGADIFAAAFLSAHSRLAAMTQERDSERLISDGHEARADRAEAALQEVRDGIARVMRQTRGGEP